MGVWPVCRSEVEDAETEPSLPYDLRAKQLYPVSMVWQPPFTMLLDLVGHGDVQVGLPS